MPFVWVCLWLVSNDCTLVLNCGNCVWDSQCIIVHVVLGVILELYIVCLIVGLFSFTVTIIDV